MVNDFLIDLNDFNILSEMEIGEESRILGAPRCSGGGKKQDLSQNIDQCEILS